MSLVSYSYNSDSEDDLDNNKLQDQECVRSNQVSTNYNISMKQTYMEKKSSKNIEIERKRNKVIIPAFNMNNKDDDTYYDKNIKLQCAKIQSLLDILPTPKCAQSKKFGDITRKQSKLIPINALKYQNKQQEQEDVTDNNNFLFSNVDSSDIYSLDKNTNNVISAKNKFNLSTSTSNNIPAANITPINLSENQYKRLKKDASNIRNINVADMLEYQKLRICKNATEEFCKAPQENVEEPSVPSRKKNHITYLAYRAKINEQELKNQWSLNKMTRQETRAKYGF